MWINLTLKELNLLQESLDMVIKKTNAELWVKIQRRKQNEERLQREKKKLDKIFQEKAKEIV